MDAPPTVRLITVGTRSFPYPSPSLGPLTDSTSLWVARDAPALRAALARDGYIHCRSVIPREVVDAAHAAVLADLESRGGILQPGTSTLATRCGLGCVPNLEGASPLVTRVLPVLEAPTLAELAGLLLGASEVKTLTYKWLRGMPRGTFTGVHCDSVYMRGEMLTSWIPFADTPMERGVLAVCARSHASAGLAKLRATYGTVDVEADGVGGSGWYDEDPASVTALDPTVGWVTGDVEAGSVIIFGMHCLHASTRNDTDTLRVSADVRWQRREAEEDPRYYGAGVAQPKAAAGAWATGAPQKTINDLKAGWGLEPTVKV